MVGHLLEERCRLVTLPWWLRRKLWLLKPEIILNMNAPNNAYHQIIWLRQNANIEIQNNSRLELQRKLHLRLINMGDTLSMRFRKSDVLPEITFLEESRNIADVFSHISPWGHYHQQKCVVCALQNKKKKRKKIIKVEIGDLNAKIIRRIKQKSFYHLNRLLNRGYPRKTSVPTLVRPSVSI